MFKKKFNLISLISYSIVSMYFDFLYTFPGFKNQRPWDFKERIFLKSFLQVSRVKNERYSNVKFFKDFLFFLDKLMMLDTEDTMDFLAHVFIENNICTVLVNKRTIIMVINIIINVIVYFIYSRKGFPRTTAHLSWRNLQNLQINWFQDFACLVRGKNNDVRYQ